MFTETDDFRPRKIAIWIFFHNSNFRSNIPKSCTETPPNKTNIKENDPYQITAQLYKSLHSCELPTVDGTIHPSPGFLAIICYYGH